MPLMLSKLYHALLNAGADEESASSAAEEVAAFEQRFNALELKLTQLSEKMDGRFNLLYWMVGTNLAATLTLMYKAFK